jgi:hypothetical protein
MSPTKKLLIVCSLLAFSAATSACADATGPQTNGTPSFETQGSNSKTCPSGTSC